jgi:hypothetical protein
MNTDVQRSNHKDKLEEKAPEYPHYDGLQEGESRVSKADARREAYSNDHCEQEFKGDTTSL